MSEFPLALLMHITIVLNASATQAISSKMVNVSSLTLLFLPALLIPILMELVALAPMVSSKSAQMPAALAHQEPTGMVRLVPPYPLKLVLMAMSTILILVSASLQLPHAVTMPTSTELPVFA